MFFNTGQTRLTAGQLGKNENSHEFLVFAPRCSQETAGAFPNGVAVLNQLSGDRVKPTDRR